MSVQNRRVRKVVVRDPDLRTLKMCVKYLDRVCSKRMVVPTVLYLYDRFVVSPRKKEMGLA